MISTNISLFLTENQTKLADNTLRQFLLLFNFEINSSKNKLPEASFGEAFFYKKSTLVNYLVAIRALSDSLFTFIFFNFTYSMQAKIIPNICSTQIPRPTALSIFKWYTMCWAILFMQPWEKREIVNMCERLFMCMYLRHNLCLMGGLFVHSLAWPFCSMNLALLVRGLQSFAFSMRCTSSLKTSRRRNT